MNRLVLIAFLFFFWRLIKRDTARRDGISAAVWIPTIWVAILTSRPLSTWIGSGGGEDSLEGSPIDRIFYLACIVAAFVIVNRRGVRWGMVVSRTWPVFLFYGYFLFSVLWAEPSSVVSFKRWYKDFGNIAIALVILTEANPAQAFRAVFVRCGYLWIPLSEIFIRWFPSLGRHYSRAGGMEATGVTFQKNSLGAMVLVCGLVLVWDWFEQSREAVAARSRIDRYWPFVMLPIAAHLLYVSDSKTSIVCLALGAIILASSRLPLLRGKIGAFGAYALMAGLGFYVLDSLFGIKEVILQNLGRNDTLTGRTEVWRVLLALKTDPIIGTGFCSFWSNRFYLSQLPYWVASSAHNGYLEMYIDGGYIGIGFPWIDAAWDWDKVESPTGRRQQLLAYQFRRIGRDNRRRYHRVAFWSFESIMVYVSIGLARSYARRNATFAESNCCRSAAIGPRTAGGFQHARQPSPPPIVISRRTIPAQETPTGHADIRTARPLR